MTSDKLFTAGFAFSILASVHVSALVIEPTFGSSITSDPNAAMIESAINQAIQIYQTNFSDAVTVKILFTEMNSGLGQSSTYYDDVSYSDFYTVLQSRATTTNDATALAHLPAGPNNPVNGHTLIRSTLAHLRMLGFPNMELLPGEYDSTISINTSLCNLDRITINPSKYDLIAVALHEMDEVLGTSSALPGESECRVADLFRYSSSGARTYTSSGDDAYFSLDGANELARYNQNSGGDFGDWWSLGPHTPQVQDAFGTAGVVVNLGVELIVLDAIGWNWTASQSTSVAGNPAFQSVAQIGNQITFTWDSVAGQNYQVQYTTNLAQGAWQNLGPAVSATGSDMTNSDVIGGDPQRFYRVKLVPQNPVAAVGRGFVDPSTLKMETRQFHRENKQK